MMSLTARAVAVATNSRPCPKLNRRSRTPAGVTSSGVIVVSSNPRHALRSCLNTPKACDHTPKRLWAIHRFTDRSVVLLASNARRDTIRRASGGIDTCVLRPAPYPNEASGYRQPRSRMSSAPSRSRATEEALMISRRKMFSFLGLATASVLAAPISIVAASDAEAQTVGMQRRHERRVGRHERREDRRTGRHERREDRRTGSTSSTQK